MSDDRWAWTPDGTGSSPPPVPSGPIVTPLTELPVWGYYEPPRRRRTGLWIGVGLGIVAFVAAGVAGWVLVGSKLMPARSPQAAVERLVDGIADKDALAVYGALSPSEVSLFRQGFDGLGRLDLPTPAPSAAAAWQDALDTVTVTVEGVELRPTTLDDGLAKVAVTDGTLRIDGNPAAIADAYVDLLTGSMTGLADNLPGDEGVATLRAEIAEQLDELLPIEVSPADDWRVDGAAPYLVAVHEGRGWYVSPLMTIGEYLLADSGAVRGSMPAATDAATYDTPEAAAEAATRALVGLAQGDAGALTATLPAAERRFAAVYLEPMLTQAEESDLGADAITVTSAAFALREQHGDRALLAAKDITIQIESEGEVGTVSFDGNCLTVTAPSPESSFQMCLSDVPLYAALDLGNVEYVAVREGGSWHVSVIATFADQMTRTVEALQRLADDGRLYSEQWWADQMATAYGWGPGLDYSGEPAFYGDDPHLDSLADSCLAGDPVACDTLYAESPYANEPQYSEYQAIAGSCGWATDIWMGGNCFQPGLRG